MQYLEKNAKYVTVIGVILSSTSAIFTKLITAGPLLLALPIVPCHSIVCYPCAN